MDEQLRNLERLAAAGDHQAAAEWTRRMVSLGLIDRVPVGYLAYLDGPSIHYNQAVMDMFARNRAMRNAALSYWTEFAATPAFSLHEQWAGPDGGFGSRHQQRLIRSFAIWARVWVALVFLQSIAAGDDQAEAEDAHEAALLAGARVSDENHEALLSLPRDPELDAMIVAMYG